MMMKATLDTFVSRKPAVMAMSCVTRKTQPIVPISPSEPTLRTTCRPHR